MPSTAVTDIIADAKAFCDADDTEVAGMIPDTRWLKWANQEYRLLYRALLRAGVVGPTPTDQDITADGSASYSLSSEPFAIIGVAEMVGNYPRPLMALQPMRGRAPWTNDSAVDGGAATHWLARVAPGSLVSVELVPVPSTGTYRVRYIPRPPELVTSNAGATQSVTVDLPDAVQDRVPLGMARRALARESTRSKVVEELIREIDAELDAAIPSFLDGNPPRVRNVDYENRGWRRRGQDQAPVIWHADPKLWWWAP